jgi:hypothetical protein
MATETDENKDSPSKEAEANPTDEGGVVTEVTETPATSVPLEEVKTTAEPVADVAEVAGVTKAGSDGSASASLTMEAKEELLSKEDEEVPVTFPQRVSWIWRCSLSGMFNCPYLTSLFPLLLAN